MMALALVAALLFATHAAWLPPIGRFLVVHDSAGGRADAVVPLAGEPERTVHAARMVRSDRADVLVITPLPGPTAADSDAYVREVRRIARIVGVADEAIRQVPVPARSTYGEAVNVRRFVEEHGIASLVVATSPWHTRRSKIIFGDVFRASSTRVAVVPVPDHVYGLPGRIYRPDTWWTSPAGRRHTASEYLKLLAHALGVR